MFAKKMKGILGILVSTVVLSTFPVAAKAQPVWWGLRSTDGPSPRWESSMVYDSSRGVTVLFGGVDVSGKLGDTWEWDGNAWNLRATTGPTPRVMNVMAFDESHGVVVLFGGVNTADTYLNDTWEWDGTSWTQQFPSSSPPTRNGAGMTYDITRGVVLLFGGWAPGLLNDTWEWDGTTWTQVSTPTRPSPRSDFAMAYDPARNRTVVFGGSLQPVSCGARSDETWELNMSASPATWTQVPTSTQPSPRAATMVYANARSAMVLFGGTEYCPGVNNFSDTWEYDGTTWSEITTPVSPSPRHGHTMALDSVRQEVLLFGGASSPGSPLPTGEFLGDTWSYGTNTGIPTVSEWGLIVMSVLLLSAGTVVFRARRTATA